MMDIIRAFHDRNLLGAGIRDFSTFKAWEAALRAIFGLGFVDDNQRAIYQRCTHRTDDPVSCREAVLLCGRRSGKSFVMALCAVWLALFRFGGNKPYLQRGEVLTIKVIAQDRDAKRSWDMSTVCYQRRCLKQRSKSKRRRPSSSPTTSASRSPPATIAQLEVIRAVRPCVTRHVFGAMTTASIQRKRSLPH
jgi:hypothetical protein